MSGTGVGWEPPPTRGPQPSIRITTSGVEQLVSAGATCAWNDHGELVSGTDLVDAEWMTLHFARDVRCWIIRCRGGTPAFVGTSRVRRLLIGSPVTVTLGPPESRTTVTFEPLSRLADPAPVPEVADRPSVPPAPDSLIVRGLTVEVRGHRRLDGVDFDLGPRGFLAILGASGAGKSTLLRAMTGAERATSGHVEFLGFDLYESFDHVRRRIGYVPQEDVLHDQLSVLETLEFAARLRFPGNVDESVWRARVDAVIEELGLGPRSRARVDELSGGQRKRVNVALELLTEPALLILDEPTSGLDPGNERSMMQLLRGLTHRGRIVIVVTHSIESLHLCDSVLFLANGGVPIYYGPPDQLPVQLGVANLADVFGAVDAMEDPRLVRVAARPADIESPKSETSLAVPKRRLIDDVSSADMEEIGRQFRILTERYVRITRADRRNLLFLLLQGPLIVVLMLAVFGSDHLGGHLGLHPQAGNVLMALALATVYLGASNAIREVVKERSILRRELNFGLSVTAYLGSKVAVLGVVTVSQAGLLVIVGTARQGGPSEAVLLGSARIELLLLVSVCGLSALCLGLMVSAFSSSVDKAMTLLPVILLVQFLLAGLIFPVSAPLIRQLSWLTTAQWGFAGAASTADFWALRGCAIPAEGLECSTLWKHEASNWLVSYTMLCALAVASLVLAWRAIERHNPGRHRQRTEAA